MPLIRLDGLEDPLLALEDVTYPGEVMFEELTPVLCLF